MKANAVDENKLNRFVPKAAERSTWIFGLDTKNKSFGLNHNHLVTLEKEIYVQ